MKKKSSSKRNRNRRSLRIESLENRNLLAADLFLHNQAMPEDVNGDQYVSPMDALAIINQLNATGYSASLGEGEAGAPSMFLDVNGDSQVSPIDALSVINTLNAGAIKAAPVTLATPTAPTTPTADVEQEGEHEGQFGDQTGPDDAAETESPEDDAPVTPPTPATPAKAVTATGTKAAPGTNATPITPTVPAVPATPTSTSTNADVDDDAGEPHDANEVAETQFVANIVGATTETASVKFEVRNENGIAESELKISATNLAADSSFDVIIGGVSVGQITTDANGQGNLVLSSVPNGTSELPLPTDFPAIDAGVTVQIGRDLTGTFAIPTSTNTDDNDDRVGEEHHIDNAGESSETKLVAVLPGIAEEMAYVEFEMESERGSSRTELGISVNFLEPRSLLDVVIDGVLIGQISTDADGHGDLDLSSHPRGSHEIPLPADFPIITSGTSIQIGTSLSGTFSVPATPTTDSAYSPTPTNRWAMSPWQWEAYHGRRSW